MEVPYPGDQTATYPPAGMAPGVPEVDFHNWLTPLENLAYAAGLNTDELRAYLRGEIERRRLGQLEAYAALGLRVEQVAAKRADAARDLLLTQTSGNGSTEPSGIAASESPQTQ